MAINTQKVLVGGLAAGVVQTGLDYLANGVLLEEQNRAAMDALNPALAANAEGSQMIIAMVIWNLLFGMILVWTYAAMRPRFGAGPKTAVIAAVQVWLIAVFMYAFMTMVGMFTWGYFFVGAIVALVELIIATQVGARLYQEE